MCNAACLEFVGSALTAAEVGGRSVIEVGARDVNGSVRPIVEALGPASYLGVDLAAGPGVDCICDACGLLTSFGREAFDIAISTEMLEHVGDWHTAISNLKGVLRPGGILILTTRSRGFPLHDFPADHWRFEPADLRRILSDLRIERLERDPLLPGVFVKAWRPSGAWREYDLSHEAVFSMIAGRRVVEVSRADRLRFRLEQLLRPVLARATPRPLKRLLKQAWSTLRDR